MSILRSTARTTSLCLAKSLAGAGACKRGAGDSDVA
jgi:hypothetical protein